VRPSDKMFDDFVFGSDICIMKFDDFEFSLAWNKYKCTHNALISMNEHVHNTLKYDTN
jgi:hypothetical protein